MLVVNKFSLIVLAFLLAISITCLSYTSQENPSYKDSRRIILLICGLLCVVYGAYSLSIQIYLMKNRGIKFQNIVIAFTFNVLLITLGSIIINYTTIPKDSWDEVHQGSMWIKDTLHTLSIITIVIIFLLLILFLLARLRGNPGIKIQIQGLTPRERLGATI